MQASSGTNTSGGGSKSGSGDVGKEILSSTMAAGAYLYKQGKKLDEKYHVANKAKAGAVVAAREAKAINKKHHVVDKSKSAMASLQAAFTSEKVPSTQEQQREAMKYDQRMGASATKRDVPPPATTSNHCTPDEQKVRQLMNMGFSKDQASGALSQHNNNLGFAANSLLGKGARFTNGRNQEVAYATSSNNQSQQQLVKPDMEKVKLLMNMGFTKDQAGEALSRNGNNLGKAANSMLG